MIPDSVQRWMGMESPNNRREADDSYQDALASVGAFSFQQRPIEAQYMAGIPDSLAIACSIVGSSWVPAAVAYLSGANTDFLLPLVVLGVVLARSSGCSQGGEIELQIHCGCSCCVLRGRGKRQRSWDVLQRRQAT
jgi:hypothetical protein